MDLFTIFFGKLSSKKICNLCLKLPHPLLLYQVQTPKWILCLNLILPSLSQESPWYVLCERFSEKKAILLEGGNNDKTSIIEAVEAEEVLKVNQLCVGIIHFVKYMCESFSCNSWSLTHQNTTFIYIYYTYINARLFHCGVGFEQGFWLLRLSQGRPRENTFSKEWTLLYPSFFLPP